MYPAVSTSVIPPTKCFTSLTEERSCVFIEDHKYCEKNDEMDMRPELEIT